MLQHGAICDGKTATVADRERWCSQIPRLRVIGTCGCGLCPTINFTEDYEPATRLYVEAYDPTQNAGIILFIDDDLPSCLEVYPEDDQKVVLPKVEDVDFT